MPGKPWFRFYQETLDDPKVQQLAPQDFKAWVNLLCLACRGDGILPSLEDVAFALRMSENETRSTLDRLAIAGLIATRKGGANGMRYAIVNWDEKQYKSDTSTDRVKRFRQRSSAVSETVTVTPPDTDTDTESDTDIYNNNIPPLSPLAVVEVIPPREARQTKGSRLAEDWVPSDAGVALCRERGLDPQETLDTFRDYWLAVPGARGLKTDWQRTWNNWCRNQRSGGKAAARKTPEVSYYVD
jgi:hypothetical protein